MLSHNKNEVVTPSIAIERAREISNLRRQEGEIPVVYIPGNAGRIGWLEALLFEDASCLTGGEKTYLFQTLSLGSPDGWRNAVAHGVTPVTPFIGPGVRRLVNEGLALNIRSHLSQVHKLFEGRWCPDVAFAHVSSPDELGRVTLGLNAGLDFSAVKNAKFKIAVVNGHMPRFAIGTIKDKETDRTFEYGCAMLLNEFDLVVYQDEPLLEHAMKVKQENASYATAIASRVVGFLSKDGDESGLPHTLQLGIGAIPNAIAEMLATLGISVRGIWSEMFSDGVLKLYEAGLIRNTRGEYLRDRIVVGFVLGSKELYRTMHENHDFVVLPQEIVNDPSMIRLNNYTASVNTALAVSLHGQVVASMIGNEHYSDVGGQYDFAYGASCSQGGISFIVLPSSVTLKDGTKESKIVGIHEGGAHHTITADLPVVVVTEQGVADLRGLSDPERVEAMLKVAEPNWRFALERSMRRLPAMQGVGVIPPRIILLKSGQQATVRPATPDDIPAIITYICALSDKDRYSRYMGTINTSFLTSAERMHEWYDKSLDFKEHAAFVVVSQGAIIGVVHAFQTGASNTYEVSFSRRSDLEGEGIGIHLMRILIDWASASGVESLHAITFRTYKSPMLELFKKFKFRITSDPEDRRNAKCDATVEDLKVTCQQVETE